MNLPDYNFLSAPLWLVTVLHVVTLTMHFVAMNFMVGGIIIVLFGKFEDKWNHPVVGKFVKLFPTAMAATVTLGVAPLLFVQLTYYNQVYSASIVSAWFWLMIIAVAIISYYFLYAGSFTKKDGSRIGTYLSLALIGFLYISFIYSSVFSLAEKPELLKNLYIGSQSGLVLNTDIGHYVFRWLHMLVGAVTVGAFFVGVLGRDNEQATRTGKNFFLWGMLASIVIGLIYLLMLGDYIGPIMKSGALWWLILSIIMSLTALYFFFKKQFTASGITLFTSVLGMVVIRQYLRHLRLEDYFNPASIPVKSQWSPFIMFLICFLLAIAVVWYMLKLYFADRKQAA